MYIYNLLKLFNHLMAQHNGKNAKIILFKYNYLNIISSIFLKITCWNYIYMYEYVYSVNNIFYVHFIH